LRRSAPRRRRGGHTRPCSPGLFHQEGAAGTGRAALGGRSCRGGSPPRTSRPRRSTARVCHVALRERSPPARQEQDDGRGRAEDQSGEHAVRPVHLHDAGPAQRRRGSGTGHGVSNNCPLSSRRGRSPIWDRMRKPRGRSGWSRTGARGCVKTTPTLAERVFTCDSCGHALDRDLNAAIDLAAWGEKNHTQAPGLRSTRPGYQRPPSWRLRPARTHG
jgi:Putative transposase DNA-binding domain